MPKATATEFDPNDLYPVPENVLVPVQLQSCEQVQVPYKDKPGSWLKWEWTFLVYEGEYAGTSLRGTTEPKVTNAVDRTFLPLARPFIEALLGRDLQIGEEIDTDLLIGYKAMATVRHLEPRPRKNGDGYWYNVEVDEIFPPYGDNVTATSVGQPVVPSGGAVWGGQDPWANAGTPAGAPAYNEPPF